MQTNADCTIYNKFSTGAAYEFKRTEIRGVMWANRKAANIIASGMQNADSAAIYIPILAECSKEYKTPKQWDALTTEQKALYWTLKPGDLIVRGIITYEIPTGTEALLIKTYDDALKITTVDRNDGGSISLQHFRVGGQ